MDEFEDNSGEGICAKCGVKIRSITVERQDRMEMRQ
jgi:hypothetical protein